VQDKNHHPKGKTGSIPWDLGSIWAQLDQGRTDPGPEKLQKAALERLDTWANQSIIGLNEKSKKQKVHTEWGQIHND